jgi:hypothetical protein
MSGNAELTKSIESLHRRGTGRIYETRTPDGTEVPGEFGSSDTYKLQLQDERNNDNAWSNTKGKARDMTQDDGYAVPGSRHSSSSSEEDKDLLPSFGGDNDVDGQVYKRNSSSSRLSLGMHKNGFISRDDMDTDERSSLHRSTSQQRAFDSNEDNKLEDDRDDLNNEKPQKSQGSGSKKQRKRKSKDRYNAGRFAKEMAFVVS